MKKLALVPFGLAFLTLSASADTWLWIGESPNTYGSSQSAAQFKDDAHFAGTGMLKVGKFGMFLLVR